MTDEKEDKPLKVVHLTVSEPDGPFDETARESILSQMAAAIERDVPAEEREQAHEAARKVVASMAELGLAASSIRSMAMAVDNARKYLEPLPMGLRYATGEYARRGPTGVIHVHELGVALSDVQTACMVLQSAARYLDMIITCDCFQEKKPAAAEAEKKPSVLS